jgi:MFS family permease
MLAWVIRYISFAFGDPNDSMFLLIMGIALHGICYDFFFVSGQIYTDHKAGEKIKNAAQGLITLATYGIGMLIGFAAAGKIVDTYTSAAGAFDWQSIWLIPAAFAAVVFVLYALLFKKETLGSDAQ